MLFGENDPSVEEKGGQSEDPFGMEEAPSEGQPQQEVQDNAGEEVEEEPGEQASPAPQEKILDKFNDINGVKESLENIGQKLGKEVNWEALETEEDIIKAYQQAEKELGNTSDVDKTRQENMDLKMENEQLKQLVQQIQQGQQPQQVNSMQGQQQLNPAGAQPNFQQQPMQQQANMQQPNMNQPQRDPNTGQFVSPQQTQQQAQQQTQDGQSAEIDHDKYWDILAEEGEEAASEYLQERVNNKVNSKLQQQQQQQRLQMQRKQAQQRQAEQFYASQIQELEQNYDDLDNYRDSMSQVINERQELLLMPKGMEIAYREAKRREMQQNQQQQQLQQQQNQIKQQKRAARTAKSNSRKRKQQKSGIEKEIDAVFKTDGNGGIFG